MANLITLEEYKEAQGITSPKEDLRTETLIASVSQLVKTYCANSFVDYFSNDKVETFSPRWGTSILQLSECPVISIVSVQERDNPTSDYVVVPTSGYYLDTQLDNIHRIDGAEINWQQGPGSVIVTYRAGYADTPADLKLAVIDLVTYYLKDEYKVRQSIGTANIDNAPSGSGRGFPDHIKRVLDLYKQI